MAKTKNLIPFFVYGSLREGLYNYKAYLEGYVYKIVPATLKGFNMYPVNSSFPAIMEGKGTVVGEVMYVIPQAYKMIKRILDSLEGYDSKNPELSMYIRKLRKVQQADGTEVMAYVYVWNGGDLPLMLVSGDWKPYYLSLQKQYQAASTKRVDVAYEDEADDEEETGDIPKPEVLIEYIEKFNKEKEEALAEYDFDTADKLDEKINTLDTVFKYYYPDEYQAYVGA